MSLQTISSTGTMWWIGADLFSVIWPVCRYQVGVFSSESTETYIAVDTPAFPFNKSVITGDPAVISLSINRICSRDARLWFHTQKLDTERDAVVINTGQVQGRFSFPNDVTDFVCWLKNIWERISLTGWLLRLNYLVTLSARGSASASTPINSFNAEWSPEVGGHCLIDWFLIFHASSTGKDILLYETQVIKSETRVWFEDTQVWFRPSVLIKRHFPSLVIVVEESWERMKLWTSKAGTRKPEFLAVCPKQANFSFWPILGCKRRTFHGSGFFTDGA